MGRMMRVRRVLVLVISLTATSIAATKIHVIAFGKWMTVPWVAGVEAEENAVAIKIRALLVDGRVKEYVQGPPHEVTDRLFVVRRVFRVNDSLPGDAIPHWQWQRGGWLLVDRVTGRVSTINLPDYDALYSSASWYRDYIAYCGVGDDGKKISAIVAQLSRRKPLLKKQLSDGFVEDAGPDSACAAPVWQRRPMRVSFESGAAKQTFAIRGHVVDVVNDPPEDDDQ